MTAIVVAELKRENQIMTMKLHTGNLKETICRFDFSKVKPAKVPTEERRRGRTRRGNRWRSGDDSDKVKGGVEKHGAVEGVGEGEAVKGKATVSGINIAASSVFILAVQHYGINVSVQIEISRHRPDGL